MRLTSKAKKMAIKATAFVCISAALGMMARSYRARDAEMTQLRADLEALNAEYYTLSMRGNAIQAQINRADEDAFIERVARREYGYTNPGEIHYTVSNLPDNLPEYENLSAGEAQ